MAEEKKPAQSRKVQRQLQSLPQEKKQLQPKRRPKPYRE